MLMGRCLAALPLLVTTTCDSRAWNYRAQLTLLNLSGSLAGGKDGTTDDKADKQVC